MMKLSTFCTSHRSIPNPVAGAEVLISEPYSQLLRAG